MKVKVFMALIGGICLAAITWFLKKPAAPHYTLAVLVRNAPLADRIYEGMREEIAKIKGARFELKFFDAASIDKIQVQTVIEEMLSQRPDLIFSIGVLFTQMCANTIKKRMLNMPLVCAVSGDPVAQGIVSRRAKREEPVTGINVAPPSNLMSVELLLQAKPSAKNVLIPYFPSSLGGEMSKSAEETARLLAERGVKAHLLPINVIGEVNTMVSGMIHKVDTIMCLSGDRIDDAYAVLAKLCDTHGVTLFAKDLEAAKTGAALSFGLSLKEIGVKMMQYAYHILVRGIKAGDLPLLFMNGHRILILNKTAAAKQGLDVTPELLALADQVVE